MVAMGSKMDYAKDMIFHVLTIAWLIYGESKILASIFEIADEIDKPVGCGVDVNAIAPFIGSNSNNSNATLPALTAELSRQLLIKDKCELRDGKYFIPYDSWSAERFWFDFFGIGFAINFATWSFIFLIVMTCGYSFILCQDSEEKRHRWEGRLDFMRGVYMVLVSMLTFNLFLLYATVLNKLAAFGVWEQDSAAAVISSKLSQAKDATLDTDSWTDIFSPDFSALFEFEKPESSNPLFLGTYVRNVAVFTSMTLLKNIFLVMISSISDDLHIVSLICATPFALVSIAAFYVPYLAALFCWKNIEYVNAMNFNFEFDHRLRTATFGGIFFGIQVLPNLFLFWVMPAFFYGKEKWDDYVEDQKKNGSEPNLGDLTFWKHTFKFLINGSAPTVVAQYVMQGTIGLSCLAWATWDADDDYAKAAYWILFACTLTGAAVSCCCCGLKLSGSVDLSDLPQPKSWAEQMAEYSA